MRVRSLPRRSLLLGAAGLAGTAVAGGAVLAQRSGQDGDGAEAAALGRMDGYAADIGRLERRREARGTGRTARAELTAESAEIDLGGRVVRTWAYNGRVPGSLVRCTAGDRLVVDLVNRLPEPTTIHWHGLRLRNDMDGVPRFTQTAVPSGERTRYSFIAPDPGTYWLHPHVGLQRERGLFAPLIIDDPREPGDYDVEFVAVLDDWLDDVTAAPDDVLRRLQAGGMAGRYRTPVLAGRVGKEPSSWRYRQPPRLATPPPGTSRASAASRMAGDVEYPFHLLNGRLPTAPETFRARPGQRARIRVINAAGASVYRLALGGHRLTVTHTDGFPVRPMAVDTLHISSGERYDLRVDLADGVFPLVAVAEGKGAQALGVIRTAAGDVPPATVQPDELAGRPLDATDLRATDDVRLPDGEPDVWHTPYLTGDMSTYGWRINAETYDAQQPLSGITPLRVREGQRARLVLVNQTPMYHPMHLHGHTFQIRSLGTNGTRPETDTLLPDGARKDTLLVPPGQRIGVDLLADNPGQWLLHCHNAYHLAAGMATTLLYPQSESSQADAGP